MKSFIVLFTLCFPAFSSFSQIGFGIKGGWNGSWINFEEKEMVMGFHVGAFTDISLSEKFRIQPELLYSTRGVVNPEYFYPFDLSIDLDYLSIPLMANYQASQKFSLQAGPEINVLLAAKIEAYDSSRDTRPYEKIEMGIAGGFTFELLSNLRLYARYIYGITPAFDIYFTDVNGQSLGGSGPRRNRCIQAGVSYRL